MSKWNKGKNYKKCRERQFIIKLRQKIADTCGIPVKYIEYRHSHLSKETRNKIKDLTKIVIKGCDNLVKHLPRKLKKKCKRIYKNVY